MTGPSRRNLIKAAGAAAGTLWLARSAWCQPRWPENPFSLGVASGDCTEDSAVLWTRLHAPGRPSASWGAAPLTVRWEIAHDEQFHRLALSGQAQALPELAHSVHVEARGLEPGRWYFYRFMVGEYTSPVGRTLTLPGADSALRTLRLAYASCQKWEDGYFSAWRHMRAEQPDGVVFLGDYIYEYPARGSRIRVPTGGWVLSLEDYRQRYALYRSDPDLAAMHAACPWWMTWDDHEVQNDYAGQQAGNSGFFEPVAPGGFAARRAAAYQAWYEHMPVRSSVLRASMAGLTQGAEMRIYQRVRFGRLADLYLLDARQYKDAQVCTKDGGLGSSTLNPVNCAPWLDPNRSLLGRDQERWLEQGLAGALQRGTRWNLIGQQTLLGPRDFKPGSGQALWNDGWDGYAAARTRLTSALAHHRVPNPVVLGGDVHENWVGQVKADYADPGSKDVGVEFCGTSISSRSGGNARLAERLAENPHFVYAEAERKGYGLLDFSPSGLATTLRVVEDVARPDSGIETLARFQVEAGQPVVQRA